MKSEGESAPEASAEGEAPTSEKKKKKKKKVVEEADTVAA